MKIFYFLFLFWICFFFCVWVEWGATAPQHWNSWWSIRPSIWSSVHPSKCFPINKRAAIDVYERARRQKGFLAHAVQHLYFYFLHMVFFYSFVCVFFFFFSIKIYFSFSSLSWERIKNAFHCLNVWVIVKDNPEKNCSNEKKLARMNECVNMKAVHISQINITKRKVSCI